MSVRVHDVSYESTAYIRAAVATRRKPREPAASFNIPIVPPIQFPLSVSENARDNPQSSITNQNQNQDQNQNQKVSESNDATQTIDFIRLAPPNYAYANAHETFLLCTDRMYTILYMYTSTT